MIAALQSSGQETYHNVEERVTSRARVSASKVRLQIWALEADRCVAATVLLANQDIFRMQEVHMELMARCDARWCHLVRLLWGGAFQSYPWLSQLRLHRPNTIGRRTCLQSNASDAVLVNA